MGDVQKLIRRLPAGKHGQAKGIAHDEIDA